MDIRTATNTTIIYFNNKEEFKEYCQNNNFYCLAQLTGRYACGLSYISDKTRIEKKNGLNYIFNIACLSQSGNVLIIHKKLRCYYAENGGYYANVRYGRAWVNSFFEIPRTGTDKDVIKKSEDIIQNELFYIN